MPRLSARLMAAIDSSSSCGPQPNCQFPPPMAQVPKPIGVICISVFPSCRVFMLYGPFLLSLFLFDPHTLYTVSVRVWLQKKRLLTADNKDFLSSSIGNDYYVSTKEISN